MNQGKVSALLARLARTTVASRRLPTRTGALRPPLSGNCSVAAAIVLALPLWCDARAAAEDNGLCTCFVLVRRPPAAPRRRPPISAARLPVVSANACYCCAAAIVISPSSRTTMRVRAPMGSRCAEWSAWLQAKKWASCANKMERRGHDLCGHGANKAAACATQCRTIVHCSMRRLWLQ